MSKRIKPIKPATEAAAQSGAAAETERIGDGIIQGVEGKIKFRKYQKPVFLDTAHGVLILHWSRQIGKSYTLASWAVYRVISQLAKEENRSWLVTVLSNSKDNGAEFVIKCQEVCNQLGAIMDSSDESPDLAYNNMRMEVRIMVGNKIGRIKVLAANPRTARGFSGDLILDEFAFHEDSTAIWEAAEPILSSNPAFRCRIASTGNGKHNMFYRMASGSGPSDGAFFPSAGGFTTCRVTRTEAWKMGVKIYDLKGTRKPITPEEARAQALDKRAYDQNYECAFADENMTLLTHELISAAQSDLVEIDQQNWSNASVARMLAAAGPLEVGQDFARNRDFSVVTVIERLGTERRISAMLRMEDLRTPEQQTRLGVVCRMPKFRNYCGDMTGNGLGMVEYLQDEFGQWRIHGVNFATTEPISNRLKLEGRKAETAKVTEIMATNMLGCFEERTIRDLPNDPWLVDDLRKPERVVSPGGRVSIAAARDSAGHADGFWSLALAVRAGDMATAAGKFMPPSGVRARIIKERHSREVLA